MMVADCVRRLVNCVKYGERERRGSKIERGGRDGKKGSNSSRLLAAAPFNVKKHIEHFEVKDEKMKRVKERNLLQSIFNVKDAESSGKIIPIEGKDAEYDAAKVREGKGEEMEREREREMGEWFGLGKS